MKSIAFATMAVLAMTSVASAAVTLGVLQNPDPAAGLRSFTVQATGIGINLLGRFEIAGSVYQVWPAAVQTEWLGDGSATGDAKDSYVVFGTERIPDLPQWHPSDPPKPSVTVETIAGGTEALGTLNNSASGGASYDAYLKRGTPSTTEETVDLLKLVIPDGGVVTVGLSVTTGDGTTTGSEKHDFFGVDAKRIYSPWDGDCDKDEDVDATDFQNFATGWFKTQPISWATGDFDLDGDVDATDFQGFATGWFSPAGPGGAAVAAVPEPSTIVMLVLGGLCLLGYRLRKR